MNKERNNFLEDGGLFFESDTHEWFKDKDTTEWAHKEDSNGTSLPNIYGFVIRDKSSGKYERVLMDKNGKIVWFTEHEPYGSSFIQSYELGDTIVFNHIKK